MGSELQKRMEELEAVQVEVDAIRSLKVGTVALIAATVAATIFAAVYLWSMMSSGTGMWTTATLIVLLIVGLPLEIVAIVKLRRGFIELTTLGRPGEVGAIGAVLTVFPFIIVGYILVGINFYELGGVYGERLLRTGGILTAIPITTLIGLIVSLAALRRVEENVLIEWDKSLVPSLAGTQQA